MSSALTAKWEMCPCMARTYRLTSSSTSLTMSTTMADPERVAAVRAFNRFYTSRLGMVRNGLHRTEHPLGESRVLYETGRGITDVSELKGALEIDAGQLSRLLTRLEAGGLITRERADGDRRRRRIRLTPAGAQAFYTLDHR